MADMRCRAFAWRFEITGESGERVTFVAESQPDAMAGARSVDRVMRAVRVRIWKAKP